MVCVRNYKTIIPKIRETQCVLVFLRQSVGYVSSSLADSYQRFGEPAASIFIISFPLLATLS
jgi:hypothetical protein